MDNGILLVSLFNTIPLWLPGQSYLLAYFIKTKVQIDKWLTFRWNYLIFFIAFFVRLCFDLYTFEIVIFYLNFTAIFMITFLFRIFWIEFSKVIRISLRPFLFYCRFTSLLLDFSCLHISDDICKKTDLFLTVIIESLAMIHIVHILILTLILQESILISINYSMKGPTINSNLKWWIRSVLETIQQPTQFTRLGLGTSFEGTFHFDHL